MAKDEYINMEVGLSRGADDHLERATVNKRALDVDGRQYIGKAHKNPLLDTRKFEVEFDDGTIEVLMANIIAEDILAQVDNGGHRH